MRRLHARPPRRPIPIDPAHTRRGRRRAQSPARRATARRGGHAYGPAASGCGRAGAPPAPPTRLTDQVTGAGPLPTPRERAARRRGGCAAERARAERARPICGRLPRARRGRPARGRRSRPARPLAAQSSPAASGCKVRARGEKTNGGGPSGAPSVARRTTALPPGVRRATTIGRVSRPPPPYEAWATAARAPPIRRRRGQRTARGAWRPWPHEPPPGARRAGGEEARLHRHHRARVRLRRRRRRGVGPPRGWQWSLAAASGADLEGVPPYALAPARVRATGSDGRPAPWEVGETPHGDGGRGRCQTRPSTHPPPPDATDSAGGAEGARRGYSTPPPAGISAVEIH